MDRLDLGLCTLTLRERKKRATEALAYNGLVQSWLELTRLSQSGSKPAEAAAQENLFQ